jgi:anti-sigma regulatory factor (Ser/Thr protein kinase)
MRTLEQQAGPYTTACAAPHWHYLPPDGQAPGKARAQAKVSLKRWQASEFCELVLLVLSELVTNALNAIVKAELRYPGTIEVRMRPNPGGGVQLEVADPLPPDVAYPEVQPQYLKSESGRGLYLVDAVTQGQWGVRALCEGKEVWAVIATPDIETEIVPCLPLDLEGL